MKKQAIAIAIASALVSPSAFAAQDTSGMQFTSASEGFYASLRARLDFSSGNHGANVDASSSRFGIRGSNDLGGGLSGFYQWEAGINIDNGNDIGGVRLGHVGLRGGFGEFVVGSFWTSDYSWTHGSTDIANTYSGYLNYSDERPARNSKALQYTTPDLNGFQGAIMVRADNSGANSQNADDPVTICVNGTTVTSVTNCSGTEVVVDGTAASDADPDANDLDAWNIAGVYAIQGFTVAGSYNSVADGVSGDTDVDLDSWTLRLGYAQDNWYVNGWYGEDGLSEGQFTDASSGDVRVDNDRENFSIAGGITLDKVHLYALYEQASDGSTTTDTAGGTTSTASEDSRGTVGVQYDLGAQSRVWVEYYSRDLDSSPETDDVVSLGLRHDF